MRAVTEFGRRVLDAGWVDLAVTRLGVDETALLAATAHRHTQFVTGLVDLAPASGGPGRLLDVVEGRSGAVVTDWLTDRCAGVQVAALDPFRGYDTRTMTPPCAPHSPRRRWCSTRSTRSSWPRTRSTPCAHRVQTDTLAHRGRRGDPLYGLQRVLLRGAERHSLTSYTGLAAGDPGGQVAAAWIATQELRHVYGATDLTQARARLFTFYTVCADAGIGELHRLARTIHTWQAQLLAHVTTGRASNGPTEAVNLLIKRIKRVGFGFRNFTTFRLRLLLHCGTTWNSHRTTRIRGRSPRLVS